MKALLLLIPLAPLAGALLAGLFGKTIGRTGAHAVTILGVAAALVGSLAVANEVFLHGYRFNEVIYTWLTIGKLPLQVGFLIDPLTTTMLVVVTFVSLMVHIYTIGYMADDPGYQRFFSYIALFTFAMLMLVMSNNFLQLFFGWEAVGLVSYLLIGFWFTRPTAVYANMKAFLVNRVGDFGFLLGIGLVLAHFGTLDYATVFAAAPAHAGETIELFAGRPWSLITVTCILLFIGAMGKSAQMPLHVWLPDSMEGPTPISALIHAATMVTAGIFMVSRMSPLFELSETARSFVLVIGATTALFMAFLGIIQYDIKRVIAYSTLSQLGYMTVALGVSAYPVAIFHLATHAFFKALLFLGAGSVIHAMHHEQDMRRMGGLRKYLPITYWTGLIGSLALAGIPPFAGFYSKDLIIESVGASHAWGSGYALLAVMAGVFITAFYSFRLLFMTFHGEERFRAFAHDDHGHDGHAGHAHAASAPAQEDAHAHASPGDHEVPADDTHAHHGLGGGTPHESPWVITIPLILLAIPSVIAGAYGIAPLVFGDYFGNAIFMAPDGPVAALREEWHGVLEFSLRGMLAPPFFLALAGIATAAWMYLLRPEVPARLKAWFTSIGVYQLLEQKYYFDRFNEIFFAEGALTIGGGLWRIGDQTIIDGGVVNGSAHLVELGSRVLRRLQTGFLYNYAFMMIFGVFALLSITLWLFKA